MRRVALAIVVLLLTPVIPLTALPAGAQEPTAAPCPAGTVPNPGFRDVTSGDVHRPAIACAAWWELARGTSAGRFSPTASLNRGQAAALIARLLTKTGLALPASPSDPFLDDRGSVHAYATNRLAAVEVVNGRAPGRFVPLAPVTRAELASMLVRALERVLGPLPPAPDAFGDDDGSVHETAIDKAAALGIARGTSTGTFSPAAALTRAQAASLVTRALEPLAAAGELGERPDLLRAASNLRPFDDCEALLGHLKERALELVGPFGLNSFGVGGPLPVGDGDREEQGTDDSGGGTSTAPSFSGTNVQEAGVDEADVVKTDGRRLISVLRGQLRVVDLSDPAAPRAAGTLTLPENGSHEVLLSGDRALVLTTSYGFIAFSDGDRIIGPVTPQSTLTLVDLTDGANPRVLRTMTVDGSIVAGRMVGSIARIVLRDDGVRLPFVYPTAETQTAFTTAEIRNRELVMASTLEDWVPRYETSAGTTGALLGCDQLRRPPEYSGLGTLSVLSTDLTGDLTPQGAAGVLAGGDVVYASTGTLYVATSRWGPWRPAELDVSGPSTEIHSFDISGASAVYRASGEVGGFVLNQFSMSEHEGVLRVATTTQPGWIDGDTGTSESQVVTLVPRDGRLNVLGSVGGLGRGEQIFAVRFIGDVGYVVTFERIDPLYTVDLSDPAAPRVVGELKILGFSAYLHPIGNGLLIGVGQDTTDEGRTTGTQISLFDVSDPAAPRRLHQAALEGGFSEVEYDHRAFLWWGPSQRAVLPVSRWTFDDQGNETSRFVGAVGFAVDAATGIREVGRLSHEDDVPDSVLPPDQWFDSSVRRSIVVGDTLLTVSERGVEASALADLTHRSYLRF